MSKTNSVSSQSDNKQNKPFIKMKNILIFSMLTSFLLSGCISVYDKTKVKGSGTVTIEQRAVTSFDRIIVNGAFTVYLSQGDTESVEVEIDDNLQKYVEVRNEGHRLVLGIKDHVNFVKTTQNNVYITLKNIESFEVSGVCKVKTSGSLDCDHLAIKVSGVANGECELYCNKLNVNLSGVANFELRGETTELNVNQSGVGKFDAMNLTAAKATVVNSGVGSVSVYATQELSMTNSGVGSITYSGDAEIKTLHSSGIGKIKKAK